MQEPPFDRAVTAKERDRHSDAGANGPRQHAIRWTPLLGTRRRSRSVIGSRSFTVTALSGLLMIIRVDANPSFFLEWGSTAGGTLS